MYGTIHISIVSKV